MDALRTVQNVTIVIFMVGNLLEVGLRLRVAEALAALRNVRFVMLSLLWCFVLGPALALLFTKIIPLSKPYALGLVLLMPFMVPLLAKGFTADPWAIAKPLLFFIALPLAGGTEA